MPNFGLRGFIGLMVAGLAAMISWGSYDSASRQGGPYVVLWGAVLWGLYYGIRNLYAAWKVQQLLAEMRIGVFESLKRDGSSGLASAAFVQLAVLVAAADGNISQPEIEAIIAFFRRHGINEESLHAIRSLITRFSERPEIQEALDILKDESEEAKISIAASLLEIAYADETLDESEMKVILHILVRLGVSAQRAEDILAYLLPQEQDNRAAALRTLELDADASEEEIKRAYRRMVQRYHPDKLAHLGPEFVDVAEQRFKQIQSAYERLSRSATAQ